MMLACWSGVARATSLPAVHFVTKPFAPYTQAGPGGQAAGPLVDLLKAACTKVRWNCSVEMLPWRRAMGMAERGEVDGIFPVVDSPARRATFLLSPAVVSGRYILVARAGQAVFISADRHELAGRTLAAYGPSDATSTLQQLTEGVRGTQTRIEADHRTVMRKLAAGRYGDEGLGLVNQAVAEQLLATGEVKYLQAVAVVKSLNYAFAFTPNRVDAARQLAFSKALHELCVSGATEDLFKATGLSTAACRPAQRADGSADSPLSPLNPTTPPG